MTAHLRTVIARLKREIAALQAKPKPRRSDYSDVRFYKKAVTTRRNAIAQRRAQIKRYKEIEMAIKSKRSIQGTHKNNRVQRERAIARAARTGKPVLLAYWYEGWQGREHRINLYAMPDGTTRERINAQS